MANNIGSLLVELGINVAAFTSGLDKATYKAKQSAKEIGNAFKGLGKDIEGFLGNFGEMGGVIGQAFSGIGDTIAKVSTQMGSLNGAAGAAVIGVTALGASAIAAGAGLAAMAIKGAELVHDLAMVSAKTGISIQDLQGLQAAGSTVGLSLDAMVMGFRKFDQALIGTGRNSSAAGVILKSLGVTSMDNKEALNQVADAFSKMENGPRKAADAIALFGRAGLNLIPLLNKGRAGLEEFDNMVAVYGPRIGKDAVQADEDFLVAQEKLSLSWDSMKVDIESKVLPSINKFISAMAEAFKSVHGLGDEISGHFGEALKSFGSGAASEFMAHPFKSIAEGGANMLGAGLGVTSSVAEGRGPSAADQQATAEAAKKKALIDLANQQGAAEKLVFEAIKDQGPAETALRLAKEKIAEESQLGTVEAYKSAEATQKQLPALERAAELEKQRRDSLLRPEPVQHAPDKVADMSTRLAEQVDRQRALASATDNTTASTLLYNAALEAQDRVTDMQRGLTEELVRAQVELQKANTGGNVNKQRQAQANVTDLQKQLQELKTIAPQITAQYQKMAVDKAAAGAASGINTSIDSMRNEESALLAMAAAYGKGADAIRAAQISQTIAKETVKTKEAIDALDTQFLSGTIGLSEYQGAVTRLRGQLAGLSEQAGKNIDAHVAEKVAQETQSLKADAAAWEISTNAVGANTQAKIAASIAAAQAKASAEGLTAPEVQVAGARAGQQAAQEAAGKLAEKAAQLDLNTALSQELADLTTIASVEKSNSSIVLAAKAKEIESVRQAQEEWDKEAMLAGNFAERVTAGLNELEQKGQDFWGSFAETGIAAVEGLEAQFAKLVVTGKANFEEIRKSMEESLVKNATAKITSFGAGALTKMVPGLSGLLPTGAKADGSSASAALWVQMVQPPGVGTGPLGLPGAGGNLPMGFNPSGLLTSMLSFIPGLASGGDVTPGQAYVVGEKHPEFFVPKTEGTVVPSLKMGGSTQQVTNVHIHGVNDVDSFQRNKTQIAQTITNTVARANGRR